MIAECVGLNPPPSAASLSSSSPISGGAPGGSTNILVTDAYRWAFERGERYGMANEDVYRCHACLSIPTAHGNGSLNLAQAVQIVCYELRMAADASIPVATEYPRASYEEAEAFFAHLEASVAQSGFLDTDNPRRFMERMRRLFGRTGLEREELQILRGMLAAWDQPRRRGDKSENS